MPHVTKFTKRGKLRFTMIIDILSNVRLSVSIIFILLSDRLTGTAVDSAEETACIGWGLYIMDGIYCPASIYRLYEMLMLRTWDKLFVVSPPEPQKHEVTCDMKFTDTSSVTLS